MSATEFLSKLGCSRDNGLAQLEEYGTLVLGVGSSNPTVGVEETIKKKKLQKINWDALDRKVGVHVKRARQDAWGSVT